jgi:hypothetical protein
MRTRNLTGGKGQPASKADSLTAIYEPALYKMWELEGGFFISAVSIIVLKLSQPLTQ